MKKLNWIKINKAKSTPREIYAIATTLGKIPEWQDKLLKTNIEYLIELFPEPFNYLL